MILVRARHLAVPGQFSFDFQLQRQTEERPDENDQSQNEDVLHCGRDNDGTDDVTSNKKLEAEQNGSTNILPVKRIVIPGALRAMECESRSCDECATHNDKYTYAIDGRANDVHDVPIIFHGSLHAGKCAYFGPAVAPRQLRL